MKNSIAIIGMSFELPGIKSWQELKRALSNKETFIGHMPDSRYQELKTAFGMPEMSIAGYLDEVDKFDNEYFGITEREALRTLPEHRLFLTHALKAFYHAGYSEEVLRGSNTGIFYTASNSVYPNYEQVANINFSRFDVISGIEATKLAQYLDSRGPVVSINTTCSSSLVAINASMKSLNAYECNTAIVGAVNTVTSTRDASKKNIVHSKKEACRPFDKEADGMMNGEGAVFFVLKRYEEAVKDGDAILGEIKGVGINHGGSRISSLTAPSSEAQKEVILKAWENAGVNPAHIRYIEAHGTGTVLGDPIEIEALKQAFMQSEIKAQNTTCALSSFKGQIGHLDYLSGLAGLLRLVAALNYRQIPLQPNFSNLNEYLDLNGVGLHIPVKAEFWPDENGERTGGVSSFGMTGTNVHLVVSQKNIHQSGKNNTEKDTAGYLQISHKNADKLEQYKAYLAEVFLATGNSEEVQTLCAKINRVFNEDNASQGIVFESKSALITALTTRDVQDDLPTILLLDLDVLQYSYDFIVSAFTENQLLKTVWDTYVDVDPGTIKDSRVLSILFQYTLYKYIFDKLGKHIKLITLKEDSLLNQMLKDHLTVKDIIEGKSLDGQTHGDFNEVAFQAFLAKSFADKEVVLVDFSKKQKHRFEGLQIQSTTIDGRWFNKDRFTLYTCIVKAGETPMRPANAYGLFDISLPYMSPKRFWPEVTTAYKADSETGSSYNPAPDKLENNRSFSEENVKRIVRNIWKRILEVEGFTDDDDFFDLGGTSICALDMADEIKAQLNGVTIPYNEIYTYATVNKLSVKILDELSGTTEDKRQTGSLPDTKELKEVLREIWAEVLGIESFSDDDDFFDLGGTSISALDMADEVAARLQGTEIPYEEIYKHSTINRLVQKVIGDVEPAAEHTEKAVATVINTEEREKEYQQLIESVKEDTFSRLVPEKILVTGATGLLGRAVVDYLLKNSSFDVYCLVRGKDGLTAKDRFHNTQDDYSNLLGIDVSRIHVVEGDLYKKDLGLSQEISVDLILHLAGSPELISRKPVQEHINLVGTKNIVDWANKNHIKRLSLVSTVGVAGKPPIEVKSFYENDTDLGQNVGASIHYATKLEAEKYIQEHYNFDAKVFRIPNLGGRYDDGYFPTDLERNTMWKLLRSVVEFECYCEELLGRNSNVSFMPIDIAASLIAEITFSSISSLKTYHIMLPKPYSFQEILNTMEGLGVSINSVTYNEFLDYAEEKNLKLDIQENEEGTFTYHSEATREAIQKLNLPELLTFERYTYLQKLISANMNFVS